MYQQVYSIDTAEEEELINSYMPQKRQPKTYKIRKPNSKLPEVFSSKTSKHEYESNPFDRNKHSNVGLRYTFENVAKPNNKDHPSLKKITKLQQKI